MGYFRNLALKSKSTVQRPKKKDIISVGTGDPFFPTAKAEIVLSFFNQKEGLALMPAVPPKKTKI